MVEEAVSRHEAGKLSLSSFRQHIRSHSGNTGTGNDTEGTVETAIPYSGAFPTLDKLDKHFIQEALKKAEGNKTLAAQLLGITYFALNRRLKKYGME